MPAPEPPPRRPDYVVLGLILVCAAFTLPALWGWRSFRGMGALRPELFWQGQYWRALTTVLIHGGFVHLAVNCLSLYFLAVPVRQICGLSAMFLFLVFGALAGLAASLLWDSGDYWRVGISGAILAFLGLILALEWACSRSLRDFLTRRNTLVVLFFLALNAGLAVYIEKRHHASVRLDHAAHVGGFVFGLLAGLATFGREGMRPLRGALAFLVLGVMPIAYAAHPFRSAQFQLERARRADGEGDRGTAEAAWASLWELSPGHPLAGARLALLRDDPGYLERSEPAFGREESYAYAEAALELALRRLPERPEEAQALLDRAATLAISSPQSWLVFAAEAEKKGSEAFALRARQEALRHLRETESWEVAADLLVPLTRRAALGGVEPAERISRARTAAEIALRAAAGLGDAARLDDARHEELERRIREAALTLGAVDSLLPPEGQALLRPGLSDLWRRLADNARGATVPGYRLRAAEWLERARGGEATEEVAALYRGTLLDARDHGDAPAAARAEEWLRGHGFPVPEPELAGHADGG